MSRPKPNWLRFAGVIITLICLGLGSAWGNGYEGLLFSPDAEVLGAKPWGAYRFIFDNREYSPLEVPSPEERTIFGQDLRLGLGCFYDSPLSVTLGLRLWQDFGQPVNSMLTLYPDIYAKLSWDTFSFLGGQYRITELHPAVFYMNEDAADLPGIELELSPEHGGGELFLARTAVPGNLRYETYAGGGDFYWGDRSWQVGYDEMPGDSLRLQWSGVHQAGFDTGGQDFTPPPGERKKESYVATLLGGLGIWDFLRISAVGGGSLIREGKTRGLFAGTYCDMRFDWQDVILTAQLSMYYMGEDFYSHWAGDEYTVPLYENVLSSDDPRAKARWMPGATVNLYFPLEFTTLNLTIDERLRFLDKLSGAKDWDRNRVMISADLVL